MLTDDEAFDLHAIHQDQLRRGHRDGLAVVARNHPAHRDAAEGIGAQHHRVQNHAADVLEIAVDAVRAGGLERGRQGLDAVVLLVVDAFVEAEFFNHLTAFVRPTGQAHRARPAHLGELTDRAANGAAGGADDHRFTGLRVDDLHQPVPAGHAGHAHRAEVGRQRDVGRVDLLNHAALGRIDDLKLLPAAHADDLVADGKVRILRLDHLARRAADHHLVQRLRRRVALALVHAAAHVRIEAQVVVAHQHLPLGQRRQGLFDQLEVVGRRLALRAGGKVDLAVGGHVGVSCWVFETLGIEAWPNRPCTSRRRHKSTVVLF